MEMETAARRVIRAARRGDVRFFFRAHNTTYTPMSPANLSVVFATYDLRVFKKLKTRRPRR